MESLSRISRFMFLELHVLTVMIFVYCKVFLFIFNLYCCSIQLLTYFLLLEISSIKQAKEQQAAEARRKATPVVGDMRPLFSALPELSELVATATPPTGQTSRRKSRKNKV